MKTKWTYFSKSATILLVLLSTVSSTALGQQMTGLLNSDRYDKIPKMGYGMSFTFHPKDKVSLKKYCPTPRNQGNMSSCVGWATGYGAYTISYCKQKNITNQYKKDKAAFNALYIYNKILPRNGTCKTGTYIDHALNVLYDYGDCNYSSFVPYDCIEKPSYIHDTEAQNYKIKDYQCLFYSNDNPEDKISNTIYSLHYGKPVIISFKVTTSFKKHKGRLWERQPYEKDAGLHAMVVVGYDDKRGVFEIMNSWGTEWGNNGFFEISYADYGASVNNAFQMMLSGDASGKMIKGDFHINRHFTWNEETQEHIFTEIKPTFNAKKGEYNVNVNYDSYFKIIASNMTQDCYVYIFSYKPDGSSEVLFPLVDQYGVEQIPRVWSDQVSVQLPYDDIGIRADQKGTDYLCVLFSTQRIDNLKEQLKELHKSAFIDLYSAMKRVFGATLVDRKHIYYKNNLMSVTANVGDGYIVPIILKADVR